MNLAFMRWLAVLLVFFGTFGWIRFGLAEMTSSNYIIRWDTVSSGGSDTSSSASYNLRDTVGGNAIGTGSTSSYQTRAGYRLGANDQIMAFEVLSQVAASEVAATGLVGTTVAVASVVGFSVGDFIAVVQDKGALQVAAIGKIVSTGVGTLTVDALANGGSAPNVDATDDYVYRLSGATADLGALLVTTVSTEIIGFNTTADVDNGYTIQALYDGKLRSGANDVNDVTDGSVTAGSEEYGARSSDTSVANSTFDTVDTAFTTSFQPVVEVGSNSFNSRSFVTLKAAMATSTPNAIYGNVLNFVVSGNF